MCDIRPLDQQRLKLGRSHADIRKAERSGPTRQRVSDPDQRIAGTAAGHSPPLTGGLQLHEPIRTPGKETLLQGSEGIV